MFVGLSSSERSRPSSSMEGPPLSKSRSAPMIHLFELLLIRGFSQCWYCGVKSTEKKIYRHMESKHGEYYGDDGDPADDSDDGYD